MMHQASSVIKSQSQNAYSDDQEKFDDTEDIEDCSDSESEIEDDEKNTAFMHHASCMSQAAMKNACFICHNVQISEYTALLFCVSLFSNNSSGSTVFFRLTC